MGKSNKKKRRKERLRQQRLETLSTFGAITITPKQNHISLHRELENSSSIGIFKETSTTGSHHEQSSIVATPQHNTFEQSNDVEFGSAASRIRSLPAVTFVYPKQDDSQIKDFRFETLLSINTIHHHDSSTEPIHKNQDRPKSMESIDDILSRKTKATDCRVNAQTTACLPSDKHESRIRSLSFDFEKRESSIDCPTEEIIHRSPYLSGISVAEAVKDTVGLRPRANSTDLELNLPQRGLCDERKVLASYKWRENMNFAAPKGFNNLGNTCFLNSTLQCLAYCPPFCQSLLEIPKSGDEQVSMGNSSSNGKKVNYGRMFTLSIAALFRRIHNPEGQNNHVLSPRRIVGSLSLLGSSSTRRSGYKFRPGRQEDAHEFLVHLLDAMNDGELREAGIDANRSGWRDRLPAPRLDETTFIHRIFGGYLRSQVRCTNCGYRSNTYDPFLDLSLEISRNNCNSVSSAIHEFTRKETLDSQNRWKCSGCKNRVCATKQLTVFRPPLSLCIQLKRFTYGTSFGGGMSMGGKKISKPIDFPVVLQLPLSDGRSCGYVLTGIVIHVGGSASSGHYTAYVQRPSAVGERKWFHMDDSFVQPVSEQHVLRQRDAYVILYCRQEVKVEFPAPPRKRSMSLDVSTDNVSIFDEKSRNIHESEKQGGIRLGNTLQKASDSCAGNLDHSLSRNSPPNQNMTSYSDLIGQSKPNRSTESTDRIASILNGAGDMDPEPFSDKFQNNKPIDENDFHQPIESERADTNFKSSTLNSDAPHNVSKFSTQFQKTASSATVEAHKGKSNKARLIPSERLEGGKIEVVMRSNRKQHNAWLPKMKEGHGDCDLLGNVSVGKWNDDDDIKCHIDDNNRTILPQVAARGIISNKLKKAENDRKRKMFLDRHDALLDQGKMKKVKNKKVPTFFSGSIPSNSNAFQRIQGLKQNVMARR